MRKSKTFESLNLRQQVSNVFLFRRRQGSGKNRKSARWSSNDPALIDLNVPWNEWGPSLPSRQTVSPSFLSFLFVLSPRESLPAGFCVSFWWPNFQQRLNKVIFRELENADGGKVALKSVDLGEDYLLHNVVHGLTKLYGQAGAAAPVDIHQLVNTDKKTGQTELILSCPHHFVKKLRASLTLQGIIQGFLLWTFSPKPKWMKLKN